MIYVLNGDVVHHTLEQCLDRAIVSAVRSWLLQITVQFVGVRMGSCIMLFAWRR